MLKNLLQPALLLMTLVMAPLVANASATVLILGDSLSAAYGIDERQGWASLLQQRLDDDDLPVEVVNASISGETTGGGRARLPALLDKFSPRIVIIELGGNDGLRGYPIGTIRANLEKMIRLCRNAEADILLLGMQIPPNYGPRYSDMFRSLYPQLAKKHDLALVPFFLQDVATAGELMQADGIHPTAEAQPRLLQNVWPELEKLLEGLQVAHNQLQ